MRSALSLTTDSRSPCMASDDDFHSLPAASSPILARPERYRSRAGPQVDWVIRAGRRAAWRAGKSNQLAWPIRIQPILSPICVNPLARKEVSKNPRPLTGSVSPYL